MDTVRTRPARRHAARDAARDAALAEVADRAEAAVRRRAELQLRHSEALTRLMAQRDDLRGVHALADFVDDSIRWSA